MCVCGIYVYCVAVRGGGCKERLVERFPCLLQDDATKERYTSLKEETVSLKAALESKEKELEALAAQTRELEEEVAQSEIKQEAGEYRQAVYFCSRDMLECALTGHPLPLFTLL